MSIQGQAIRQLFLLLSSFLFAIVAHTVSGGEILGATPLALQLGCIALILLVAKNVVLEGPTLALLIALIQSSSHFILGGNTYTSEIAMTIGHFFSGLVTYWLVKYFDLAWNIFIEVIKKVLLPALKFWRIPSLPLIGHFRELLLPQWQLKVIDCLKYRGPPMRLDFSHAS